MSPGCPLSAGWRPSVGGLPGRYKRIILRDRASPTVSRLCDTPVMLRKRDTVRIAVASFAVIASVANGAESGGPLSSTVAHQYRQDVSKWPPFVVDEDVRAQELGELPPLSSETWHTPASEALGKLLFFDPRLSESGQIAGAFVAAFVGEGATAEGMGKAPAAFVRTIQTYGLPSCPGLTYPASPPHESGCESWRI